MDGIGPRDERPKKQNTNWGGTMENNSFGTHEFLNLCELLGCEPYVSANVGSGSVREMEQWLEYMNSENDTPMARLRRQNGRDKAWGELIEPTFIVSPSKCPVMIRSLSTKNACHVYNVSVAWQALVCFYKMSRTASMTLCGFWKSV